MTTKSERCSCGELISDTAEQCPSCKEDQNQNRIDFSRYRYLAPAEMPRPGDEMRPSRESNWWLPVTELQGDVRDDQIRLYRRKIQTGSRGWRLLDLGEYVGELDQVKGTERWRPVREEIGRVVADGDL